MYFKNFEDYLQSLAVSHVELRHGLNGQKSFIRLLSGDEVNVQSLRPGAALLIVENVTGESLGDFEDDRYVQRYTLSFLKMATGLGASPSAGIDAALDTTFHIMMQFIARMKKDYTDDSCGPMKGISHRMSYQVVQDRQLVNHYGWELNIKQTITAPEYDATKWV